MAILFEVCRQTFFLILSWQTAFIITIYLHLSTLVRAENFYGKIVLLGHCFSMTCKIKDSYLFLSLTTKVFLLRMLALYLMFSSIY